MMKRLACLLLCVTILSGISAQTLSDSVHFLEDVEIRMIRKSEVPAGSTLDMIYLTRSALLKNQGNTFVNTLQRIPGISAIQTGVGIAKPVIRGLSLNRVVVNEYGIKQEGQQWGIDHGLEMDQFNVDRVEVLKGPVSVLYGSDGIGGVISILPPLIPEKNTSGGEAILQYKSGNDLYGASLKLQQNRNDFYSIVRATYQDYGSYRVPADSFTYNSYRLPIHNRRLKNTGGRELNISVLNGIRRKWGHSSLYISNYHQDAGFFTGAFGIPRAYQLAEEGGPRRVALPRQQINHFKVISNTHFHFPGGSLLEADLGYQYNLRRELAKPHAHGSAAGPEHNPHAGNTALQLDLHTLTGNLRYKFHPAERLDLITGISVQHQTNVRAGYEFLIPGYRFTQGGLFVFGEYQLSRKLLFSGGFRADAAQQSAAEGRVDLYDAAGAYAGQQQRSGRIDRNYLNGSGSLGMAWEATSSVRMKANAGTAYRVPALVELTANGVHHGTFRHELGDARLSPERGYMLDAGVYARSRRARLRLDVTPFVNYFANYIYLRPSARFSTLPEAGQVYHYTEAPVLFAGTEAVAVMELSPSLTSTLSAEYVWNRNLQTDIPLPFTPPFSVLEELEYKPEWSAAWMKDFFLGISGQYFAAQRRVDVNEPETDGYFLANITAGNTFTMPHGRLSALLQLRNLTNARYLNNMSRYRILNLPEQGINLQVMLRYEF